MNPKKPNAVLRTKLYCFALLALFNGVGEAKSADQECERPQCHKVPEQASHDQCSWYDVSGCGYEPCIYWEVVTCYEYCAGNDPGTCRYCVKRCITAGATKYTYEGECEDTGSYYVCNPSNQPIDQEPSTLVMADSGTDCEICPDS